jgi:hypothetical protein
LASSRCSVSRITLRLTPNALYLAADDAAIAQLPRRFRFASSPTASRDRLPGSRVGKVYLLNARLIGSVTLPEFVTKSLAVSLA